MEHEWIEVRTGEAEQGMRMGGEAESQGIVAAEQRRKQRNE